MPHRCRSRNGVWKTVTCTWLSCSIATCLNGYINPLAACILIKINQQHGRTAGSAGSVHHYLDGSWGNGLPDGVCTLTCAATRSCPWKQIKCPRTITSVCKCPNATDHWTVVLNHPIGQVKTLNRKQNQVMLASMNEFQTSSPHCKNLCQLHQRRGFKVKLCRRIPVMTNALLF